MLPYIHVFCICVYTYVCAVMCYFATETFWEKVIVRQFCGCENITEYLHKPSWGRLLHTQTTGLAYSAKAINLYSSYCTEYCRQLLHNAYIHMVVYLNIPEHREGTENVLGNRKAFHPVCSLSLTKAELCDTWFSVCKCTISVCVCVCVCVCV
jgi:hypothetical protein